MKYAVIQTGGKQYKVSEGSVFHVERLPGDQNASITFSDVLLLIDEENIMIGTPYVDGMSVQATIMDHIRGKKIRVSKFKAKARYRRVQGHRQELSTIRVDAIGNGKTTTKKEVVEGEVPEVKAVKKPRATKKVA